MPLRDPTGGSQVSYISLAKKLSVRSGAPKSKMSRKRALYCAVGSDTLFHLLRLKHELQNGAKVSKAVVNQVDVLRLCRALGMAVSDEGNRVAMRNFEFGQFRPSSYDADFARFIREKLAAAGSRTDEEDNAPPEVEIGCLFGRQSGVRAELTRMELWDSDCVSSLTEQGVYCIEKGGADGDHRKFVAFAWLNASLFDPDSIRDTPAYELRFLMALSPHVSCCLSRDDFLRVKSEVDAASSSTTMQWNSCSVAFRVQKQEKQSDSVRCAKPTKAVIPSADPIKSVEFIGGVFPAVAVESATPLTTDWTTFSKAMSMDDFVDGVMELCSCYTLELPLEPLRAALARDCLLDKFNCYPDDGLAALRKSLEEELVQAKERIDRAVSQELNRVMTQNTDVLFAARTPANASKMDKARTQYKDLLQTLNDHGVLAGLEDETRTALRMAERMQANMKALHDAYVNNSSRHEAILNEIMNGTPVEAANNSSQEGWLKALARGFVRRIFSGNEQVNESRRHRRNDQVERGSGEGTY